MKAYSVDQRQGAFFYKGMKYDVGEFLYRFVIVPFVAFLPAGIAYRIACMRGNWAYQHHTSTRQCILQNIESVLGDQLSSTERDRVTRDFFRRRACEAIDVMRLVGKGRALKRLVEIRGLEHIEAALSAGRGAVICSLHFGSFNCCFSLLGAYGFPITAVGDWRSTYDSSMSPLQRLLWRFIQEKPLARHRRRPNIEPQKDRFGSAMRMAEILRSNEIIALGIDDPVLPQDRERAIRVDFLGRQVLLLPGSISIAQLSGSPVLVLAVRRLDDWRHQVLEISPPVSLDSDLTGSFQRCIQILEASVRQNPSYWDRWTNTQDLIDFGLLPT